MSVETGNQCPATNPNDGFLTDRCLDEAGHEGDHESMYHTWPQE